MSADRPHTGRAQMSLLLYSVLPRPAHPTRDGLAIRNFHMLAALARVPGAGGGTSAAGVGIRRVPARHRGRGDPSGATKGPAGRGPGSERAFGRGVPRPDVSVPSAVLAALGLDGPGEARVGRRPLLPRRARRPGGGRPGLGGLPQRGLGDLAADGGERGWPAAGVPAVAGAARRATGAGHPPARRRRLVRFREGRARSLLGGWRTAARRLERRGPGALRLPTRAVPRGARRLRR